MVVATNFKTSIMQFIALTWLLKAFKALKAKPIPEEINQDYRNKMQL
tara:strand:- start:3591 stop:3731 length:141 start_codon:yes stop_codon:yes gene_type:complete